MHKIKRYWPLLLLALLLLCGMRAQNVQAASGASFTVKPQLTKQQVGSDSGYFNLQLQPHQQQTLAIKITNLTAKTKTLKVTPTNAWTTSGGQLAYSPSKIKANGAQYRFTELLSSSKPLTIKLPANATRTVSYKMTMPTQTVRGQILGGLYVLDTASYGGGGSGMELVNRFAMVVAVQLQSQTQKLAPTLQLGNVKVGTQSAKAAVLATVENTAPRLFNQLTIKARVTRRGESKTLLKRTVKQMSMAPNSHFAYGIYTKNALKAGRYTLHLQASAQSWHWQFTRHFTVSAKQAAKVNKQDKLKPAAKKRLSWLQMMLIVMAVAIVILAVLLWRALRRGRHAGK